MCVLPIADIGLMLGLKRYKHEVMAHHCLVIIGFLSSFYSEYGSNEIIACIWCTEPSNLLMYARFVLKNLDLKPTKLYLAVEVIYWIVFIIGRLGFGTVVVYNWWTGPNWPFFVSLTGTGVRIIYQINLYIGPFRFTFPCIWNAEIY